MADDVTVDLVRTLIEHMSGASEDWESLAMVVYFDGRRFAGTHGFTYSPSGEKSAVASRPSAIGPAVDAYIQSRYTPDQEPPVKFLMQFDRTKGTYEVTFEDSDVSRWKVTPANFSEMSEQLRPRFD